MGENAAGNVTIFDPRARGVFEKSKSGKHIGEPTSWCRRSSFDAGNVMDRRGVEKASLMAETNSIPCLDEGRSWNVERKCPDLRSILADVIRSLAWDGAITQKLSFSTSS